MHLPPPPDLENRIKELEYVENRRHNPVTPPEYSNILDLRITDVFDQILIKAGIPGWHSIIEELKNEIKPEIHFWKNYFNEMRPSELAESIGGALDYDYLESAQTPSYPSGHTAQAFYIALCLSDQFPNLKFSFLSFAEMVAESRIDRGVHFPSDNEAGKQLAFYLYENK